MSKGSPIIPVRIPAALLALVDQAIAARNEVARGEPWNRTDFILTSVHEKLAKMARSRAPRRKGK